ncbi:MAG: hypothetical protein COA74_01960 [Gammaproteobacteria bacterium]|nr:MAG: hypothetical protein COA74_01960 [Gammaproteobacteria bacterium]
MKKYAINFMAAVVLSSSIIAQAEPVFQLDKISDLEGNTLDEWVAHNQPLIIRLSIEQLIGREQNSINELKIVPQFLIMLGNSDITDLFEFTNNRLVFPGGLALPPGENQLRISQLTKGQWIEIATHPLNVMTSAGFKQAEWTPSLNLNINSQLDEQVSGDNLGSQRPTYSDVTASIGLAGHHKNDDFSIDTNINLLAVSNRQQAIQYSNKLNQARKWDVSNYSVKFKSGNNRIIVGHTSYGNNPLLISNLSRRGVSWQYQNENQLTFNGAILSGSDIVGYNNFLGLANYSQQFVNSLGFGFNTFSDSRISVRIEGTYLDAQRQAQNDFGIGEIASAEKNQGMGFRLIANDSKGRLNADLSIGLSRYTNPEDLNLSFGDELVTLKTETAMAYNLNMSYQLIQQWETPWGSNTNLTLNANSSSTDPLYQTLTAFVQANIENNLLGAQYQVGSVSGNLSTRSSRDNLDNLVSLLTTETKNDSFSANMPLAQILSSDEDIYTNKTWLPSLNYSFQQTHQYAINSPGANISGFNGASHLPDQLTTNHSLASNWQFEHYSLSLQSNYNQQDNRQIGRELADFSNLRHAASVNIQQGNTTSWSFSLGKNRLYDLENNKKQYSKSATVSYNWQSIDGLSVSVNYGLSKNDDSLDEASSTSTNADIGLVKNLIKGGWWFQLNGSISLRINYNDSESINRVFDQASRFGSKTVQLNVNLSY